MKKHIFNFRATHVFADGTVMTGEEFDRSGKVFNAEDNKELLEVYARQASPEYRAAERARRRFERIEKRKQELWAEQERIQKELAEIK